LFFINKYSLAKVAAFFDATATKKFQNEQSTTTYLNHSNSGPASFEFHRYLA